MKLQFRNFELDVDSATLRKDGVVVGLCPQPFRVLALLASRPGELVTREELRTAIWDAGTHVDFQRGLNTCMSQIRSALGTDSAGLPTIETVPRRGYRFVASVVRKDLEECVLPPTEVARVAVSNGWPLRTLAAAAAVVLALSMNTRGDSAPVHPGREVHPSLAASSRSFAGADSEQSFATSPIQPVRVSIPISHIATVGRSDALVLDEHGSRATISNAELFFARGQAIFERGDNPFRIVNEMAEVAIPLFHRAVELNSRLPGPYLGLARAYISKAFRDPVTRTDSIRQATSAVHHALALDASLAQAVSIAAELKYRFEGDWPGAEREFLRAIELEPASLYSRQQYARMLMRFPDRVDDALKQLQVAQTVDPLSVPIRWNITSALTYAHRYDECVVESRKNMELDPAFSWGNIALGRCLEGAGKVEEAIEAYQRAGPASLGYLGHAYALAGHRRRAVEVLHVLERQPYYENRECDIAMVYGALGVPNVAFEWLLKASANGASLARLPLTMWDPLREDRRFVELTAKVGL